MADGGTAVSPEIARRVFTFFQHIRPEESTEDQLTPHEMRILTLLAGRHNYITIRRQWKLGLSLYTISFRVWRICEKRQVPSKSEAVAKALRSRLIR